MEGAVLAGKLAAEVIVDKAVGLKVKPINDVHYTVMNKIESWKSVNPVGINGDSPIVYGGGDVFSEVSFNDLKLQDTAQLIE